MTYLNIYLSRSLPTIVIARVKARMWGCRDVCFDKHGINSSARLATKGNSHTPRVKKETAASIKHKNIGI